MASYLFDDKIDTDPFRAAQALTKSDPLADTKPLEIAAMPADRARDHAAALGAQGRTPLIPREPGAAPEDADMAVYQYVYKDLTGRLPPGATAVGDGQAPFELSRDLPALIAADLRTLPVTGLFARSMDDLNRRQDTWKPYHTDGDLRVMPPAELVAQVATDGLAQYTDAFRDVVTAGQYEERRYRVERELEDNRIQGAAGYMGLAVGLATQVADPTSYIPLGAGANIARGALGVVEAGAKGAAVAGGFTLASELARQSREYTRTAADSALAVGLGTLTGALLGGTVHALIGSQAAASVDARRLALADAEHANFSRERANAANILDGGNGIEAFSGIPARGSLGAAAVDEVVDPITGFRTVGTPNPLDAARKSDRLGGDLLAFRSLEALPGVFEKIPFIGKPLAKAFSMPSLELARSYSSHARDYAKNFAYSDAYTAADLEAARTGVVKSGNDAGTLDSVLSLRYGLDGKLYEGISQLQSIFREAQVHFPDGQADFDKEVYRALVSGDVAQTAKGGAGQASAADLLDPKARAVTKAAQVAREYGITPTQKALEANGNVTVDMQPKNAESYMPLVFDVDKVAGRLDTRKTLPDGSVNEDHGAPLFVGMEREAYAANYRAAREEAIAKAKRATQNIQDAKIDIHGEDALVPKLAKDGSIVTRTITKADGSKEQVPVLTSKVLKQGTFREAVAQAEVAKAAKVTDLTNAQTAAETAAQKQHEPLIDAAKEPMAAALVRVEDQHDDIVASAKLSAAQQLAQKGQSRAERSLIMERRARIIAEAANKLIKDREKVAASSQLNGPINKALRALDSDLSKVRRDYAAQFVRLDKEHAATLAGLEKEAASKLSAVSGDNALTPEERDLVRMSDADVDVKAQAHAQGSYDVIIKSAVHLAQRDVQAKISAPSYLKGRTTAAQHLALIDAGFARTSLKEVLSNYVRTAGTDASMGAVFKRPVAEPSAASGASLSAAAAEAPRVEGDIGLSHLKEKIATQYKDMIDGVALTKKQEARLAKVKDPATKIAAAETYRAQNIATLTEARDKDLAHVDFLHNEMRGSHASSMSRVVQDGLESLRHINYFTKMGGVVLSSLNDVNNIVIANGLGRTAANGVLPTLKTFAAIVKDADVAELRLMRLQRVNFEAAQSRIQIEMSGAMDPMERTSNFNTMARRFAVPFSQLTGATYWNRLVKMAHAGTTNMRLQEYAAEGWDALQETERLWLANNRIGKAQLEAIQAADLATPEHLRTVGEHKFLNTEVWTDKEAATRVDALMAMEATRGVVEPGAVDKLSLSGNAWGRSFFQFRNFIVATQTKVIGRNAQLAALGRRDAARFYSTLGLMAVTGAFIAGTKGYLSDVMIDGESKRAGQDALQRQIDEWTKAPGQAMYNSLSAGGLPLPLLLEADQTLTKLGLPGAKSVFSKIAGDDPSMLRTANRMTDRGRLDSLLGPSAGLAVSAMKLGAGLTDDLSRGHLSRGTFRAARQFLPGQNAVPLQQTINWGEANLEHAFDWQPLK